MAAIEVIRSESPVQPRHLAGTELGMEIIHLKTDGTPSDTTIETKIISKVLAVIGVDGYLTLETDELAVTSSSGLTKGNQIKLLGAKVPVSTNFTIIAVGKGGA